MEIKEISTNVVKYQVNGMLFNNKFDAQSYINKELERRFLSDICHSLEFNVSEDHFRLLKRMQLEWWSCEFGSPAIDCKKPYGDSSVYSDIAEILDIPYGLEEDEWYTDEQLRYMDKRHREMENYLQILCHFGEIPSGKYERKALWENWEKVE
jgi:hypothetical protein